MGKRRTTVLALVACVALLATACGGDDDDGAGASRPDGDAQEQTVDTERTVRFTQTATPGQWDPHNTPSPFIELIYQTQVYDRFLQLEVDSSLSPMLATSWAFDDSGLVLTMQLREDVTFHDGSAFDADVAVANLERAREAAVKGRISSIESVEATGPYEIRITLSRTDPTLLFELANQPGMVVSEPGMASPDLATQPAGSGPFRLARAGADIAVFDRNDDYWDTEMQLPAHKEIVSLSDDSTKLSALQTGAVDIAFLRPASIAEAERLAATGDYEIYTYPAQGFYGMYFNNKIPPLDNVRVRKAIAMAIDRAAMNDALFSGQCDVSSQIFPEGVAGHDPDLGDGTEYDPEEAKRIVEEEGATGATIRVVQQGNEPHATNAQAIQAQLAEIGINLELERTETNLARTTWREGGHGSLITTILSLFPDPAGYLNSYLGPDNPGDPDPELVRLAEEAGQMQLDDPDRDEAYREINRYLLENPVHTILCGPPTMYLARADVLNADNLPYSGLGAFPDTRHLVMAAEG